MAIVDVTYRTLTCNAPGCEHSVTFENPKEAQTAIESNLWLKTGRVIQTGAGKMFFYCSDVCEVAGVETGQHNPVEEPKVEIAQGGVQAQIAAAAAAAKEREKANEALKKGSPITIK